MLKKPVAIFSKHVAVKTAALKEQPIHIATPQRNARSKSLQQLKLHRKQEHELEDYYS
jgi:hypothetical protein